MNPYKSLVKRKLWQRLYLQWFLYCIPPTNDWSSQCDISGTDGGWLSPTVVIRSLAIIFPLPSVLHFVSSMKARHVSTIREDYIHYTLVCANTVLLPPANTLLGTWTRQKGWGEAGVPVIESKSAHHFHPWVKTSPSTDGKSGVQKGQMSVQVGVFQNYGKEFRI